MIHWYILQSVSPQPSCLTFLAAESHMLFLMMTLPPTSMICGPDSNANFLLDPEMSFLSVLNVFHLVLTLLPLHTHVSNLKTVSKCDRHLARPLQPPATALHQRWETWRRSCVFRVCKVTVHCLAHRGSQSVNILICPILSVLQIAPVACRFV